MSREKLPGYEFAMEKGYELNAHSGDRTEAYYNKFVNGGWVHLTITHNPTGELIGSLERHFRMIKCKAGNFSIPNKNFEIFEKQILAMQMIE